MGPHFDRLLEESEPLPLGNRGALARVAALCGDADATAEGVALEAARDEGFAALLTPVSELRTAVARLGFGLVRQAGVGMEAPIDPSPSALELARIGDLEQARGRLQLLLDAQERFDLRLA